MMSGFHYNLYSLLLSHPLGGVSWSVGRIGHFYTFFILVCDLVLWSREALELVTVTIMLANIQVFSCSYA